MTGTIIITGANGSLAIPAVQHLLANYPNYALVLTVRNRADIDTNTKRLREVLNRHPHVHTSIRELDLAVLSDVHNLATAVAAEIDDGKLPPLASIVCNASYWNLIHVGAVDATVDGYEKTFQVNHLGHAALVLRLLGSFGASGGRVVLFSSDAHWKDNVFIPTDLKMLVKPDADDPPGNFEHGWQRFAVSKLVVVMWMYVLNRYLEQDPKLSNITAVAINPGNLSDSRFLRTNTPTIFVLVSKLLIKPFRFLLQFIDPILRTAAKAGVDVADLATNRAHPGDRGYFTLLKKDASAPNSMNEETQQKLWVKSMEWAKITQKNTELTLTV